MGLGDETGRLVPTRVGAASWTAVSAGLHYTCGIQTDGSLWCWGHNLNGNLGDGTQTKRLSPVRIGSQSWSTVSASPDYIGSTTCGIQLDQTAWCWGENYYGQIGDGTATGRHVPTQVVGGGTYGSVIVGAFHTCGLRTDGTAWCWGSNSFAQLGDGSRRTSRVPVAVVGDHTFTSLAAMGRGTVAITADRELLGWGSWGAGHYNKIGKPTEVLTTRGLR